MRQLVDELLRDQLAKHPRVREALPTVEADVRSAAQTPLCCCAGDSGLVLRATSAGRSVSAKKSIQSGYGLGESWGVIDRIGILPCYDTENMRQLDRRSALAQGLSEDELMIKAGEAAFRALSEKWPEAATLAVLCGRGNNGGDGCGRAPRTGGGSCL